MARLSSLIQSESRPIAYEQPSELAAATSSRRTAATLAPWRRVSRGTSRRGRAADAADRQHRTRSHGRHRHRALDGRRHGAHRDLRSQALHAVRNRARSRTTCSARSRRSTPSSTTSSSREGLENIAKVMDRGTLIRSYTAGDLGLHPALAASVSLAHRLRAAADRGRAAHRRGHRAHARPARTRRAGVHRHRPAVRSCGEGEELKAFHTGRLPRQRVRPVPDSRSRRRRSQPSARRRDEPGALRRIATQLYKQAARGKARSASSAATIRRSRCCARWTTPTACSARRPPRRSISRSSRRKSYDTYNTGRFGLGCLLARRLAEVGRALHRSHHRIHPVPQLGHARQRPHAPGRAEADDRRARSRSSCSTSKSAACSTAR